MQSFKENLEAYGVDYQTTMNRFMGNEKMYLKLLNLLFQDDNLQKLGKALDEKNYTAAFEAAHTLKGVVGNMGLTPLYQEVCAIVEPLRAKKHRDDYSVLYQNIQTEFKAVDVLRSSLEGGEQT